MLSSLWPPTALTEWGSRGRPVGNQSPGCRSDVQANPETHPSRDLSLLQGPAESQGLAELSPGPGAPRDRTLHRGVLEQRQPISFRSEVPNPQWRHRASGLTPSRPLAQGPPRCQTWAGSPRRGWTRSLDGAPRFPVCILPPHRVNLTNFHILSFFKVLKFNWLFFFLQG